MAFGQVNRVGMKMEPIGDGPRATDDEDVVQTMWDAVRNTHSTDMEPLRFKNMNYAQSYKWADALKDFVCLKFICTSSLVLI